jgi:hypothetical protein
MKDQLVNNTEIFLHGIMPNGHENEIFLHGIMPNGHENEISFIFYEFFFPTSCREHTQEHKYLSQFNFNPVTI